MYVTAEAAPHYSAACNRDVTAMYLTAEEAPHHSAPCPPWGCMEPYLGVPHLGVPHLGVPRCWLNIATVDHVPLGVNETSHRCGLSMSAVGVHGTSPRYTSPRCGLHMATVYGAPPRCGLHVPLGLPGTSHLGLRERSEARTPNPNPYPNPSIMGPQHFTSGRSLTFTLSAGCNWRTYRSKSQQEVGWGVRVSHVMPTRSRLLTRGTPRQLIVRRGDTTFVNKRQQKGTTVLRLPA